MMHCEEIRSLLDEFIDDELSGQLRQMVQRHLGECPRCHHDERRLREILRDARDLEESHTRLHRLWPAVEARIGGPKQAAGRRAKTWPKFAMGAAAVLFVSGPAMLSQLVSNVHAPSSAGAELSAFGHQELEYRRAKEELLNTLRSPDGTPSRALLSRVDKDLAATAVAESDIRTALVNSPSDPNLERMLLATYRSELKMLRDAARRAPE